MLFKPTKSTKHPFRPTGGEAMSYFVGAEAMENAEFEGEDAGFAINGGKGWKKVRPHRRRPRFPSPSVLSPPSPPPPPPPPPSPPLPPPPPQVKFSNHQIDLNGQTATAMVQLLRL